jgi:DNA-binding NarL/FixJ family response regulator
MRVINQVKRVCVLLVEDHDGFRKELMNILVHQGAIVFGAKSHEKALQTIGLHWDEIDAIVLDACVETPGIEYDADLLLGDIQRLNRPDLLDKTGKKRVLVLGLSGLPDLRNRLRRHGCHMTSSKSLEAFPKNVVQLLSDVNKLHRSG